MISKSMLTITVNYFSFTGLGSFVLKMQIFINSADLLRLLFEAPV